MPDFSFEWKAIKEGCIVGSVCGIDEVGRGPLAGPVMAAAAILDPETLPESLRRELDDSKKLSAKKREALTTALLETPAAQITVAQASVDEIDQLNILRATHLAMRRAIESLPHPPAMALIDGNRPPPDFPCPTHCIVKGDSLSLSIAAASIVAKVTRDRLMTKLAIDFPLYGWNRNMGYGTAEHRAAIRQFGLTRHHRRSFSCQGRLL